MALIVEDGTVVEGANSYVTLEAADAVLSAMGNTAWMDKGPEDQEADLIKAFFLSDDPSTYQFTGMRADALQESQWPRVGATRYRGPAVPDGTIPPEVKRAQIIAAGGIADGSIIWGASATEQAVKSESLDGVGSTSYFEPGRQSAAPERSGPFAFGWPSITSILAPLLDRGLYTTPAAGPAFTRPAYGGLFQVGMHDAPGGSGRGIRDDGYDT